MCPRMVGRIELHSSRADKDVVSIVHEHSEVAVVSASQGRGDGSGVGVDFFLEELDVLTLGLVGNLGELGVRHRPSAGRKIHA